MPGVKGWTPASTRRNDTCWKFLHSGLWRIRCVTADWDSRNLTPCWYGIPFASRRRNPCVPFEVIR